DSFLGLENIPAQVEFSAPDLPQPPKLLVELEPWGRSFGRNLIDFLLRRRPAPVAITSPPAPFWPDVFVVRRLPWVAFAESLLYHGIVFMLAWGFSALLPNRPHVVEARRFDPADVIYYSPSEYLPPLDTGASQAPKPQHGDPEYARQPILSVPPEADNRRQTIVAPPDVRLNRDLPLPNIIAMSTPAPVVPIEATRAPLSRLVAPETQVVAPAPELDTAQSRVVRSALTSPIIAPPPEVTSTRTRGMSGPDASVVEPPPDVTRSNMGRAGALNIGPSQVVAPAPQLTIAEQHTLSGRGTGGIPSGGLQPVAP